jgi:uncharacterized protein (DUF2147 family)
MLNLIAGLLLAFPALHAADSDAVLGKWSTQNGKSTVEIFACGTKLCGRIVALKSPLYTDASEGPVGTPKVDRKNPDPTLRSKPLIGFQLMEGFVSTGKGTWGDGIIYDPDSGKTYKCKMKLASPQHLEIRGYIGISLLGRTEVWTR